MIMHYSYITGTVTSTCKRPHPVYASTGDTMY